MGNFICLEDSPEVMIHGRDLLAPHLGRAEMGRPLSGLNSILLITELTLPFPQPSPTRIYVPIPVSGRYALLVANPGVTLTQLPAFSPT